MVGRWRQCLLPRNLDALEPPILLPFVHQSPIGTLATSHSWLFLACPSLSYTTHPPFSKTHHAMSNSEALNNTLPWLGSPSSLPWAQGLYSAKPSAQSRATTPPLSPPHTAIPVPFEGLRASLPLTRLTIPRAWPMRFSSLIPSTFPESDTYR